MRRKSPNLSDYLEEEKSADEELVHSHYSRQDVKNEILRFSRGRWLAITGEGGWIRHLGRRPLTVESLKLPTLLLKTRTRAIYATTSVYRKLRTKEDPYLEDNVVAVTPYLDIDNGPEYWRATIETAKIIIDELERLGVVKSVYVLWSGRGAHVRVHELALSREMRNLDSAWALSEFVRMRIEVKVAEIRARYEVPGLKVENQLKPRSLFTVPLSLHRRIDRVAICMTPDRLGDFDLSWTEPGSFIHDPHWDGYEVGEADHAAREALDLIGGYPVAQARRRRKEPPVDEMVRKWNGEQ